MSLTGRCKTCGVDIGKSRNGPIVCRACWDSPGHSTDPVIKCWFVDTYKCEVYQIETKLLLFGYPDGKTIAYGLFGPGEQISHEKSWDYDELKALHKLRNHLIAREHVETFTLKAKIESMRKKILAVETKIAREFLVRLVMGNRAKEKTK